LLNDDKLLYGEEPILLNGESVGAITSGMYGHRIGASCAMGYIEMSAPITKTWLETQVFEIEVGWERYATHAQLEPLYDPKSLKVKA
jgi:4-methylaminobutanoate oxidase (formaldehyde-forming)